VSIAAVHTEEEEKEEFVRYKKWSRNIFLGSFDWWCDSTL